MRNRRRSGISTFRDRLSLLHLVAFLELDTVLLQVVQQGKLSVAVRNEDHIAAGRIRSRFAGRVVQVAVFDVHYHAVRRRQHWLTKAVVVGIVSAVSAVNAAALEQNEVDGEALLIREKVPVQERRTAALIDEPVSGEGKLQLGGVLVAAKTALGRRP